jgi:hypothetical protein
MPVQIVILPSLIKLSVLLGLLVLFIFVIHTISKIDLVKVNGSGGIERFFGSMWFLPVLTAEFFIPLLNKGGKLIKLVDQG